MTLEEAARLLGEFGLIVQVGPGSALSVAAHPGNPPEQLPTADENADGFGFSLREVGGAWLLGVGTQADSEHTTLEDAVSRGLRLLREYREFHSPWQYGDQFALC